MKSKKIKPPHHAVENLLKIIRNNGITQENLSECAGIAPSQMSKVFKGNVQLNLWQLSNIATCLKMREIDIITYPETYELMGKTANFSFLKMKLYRSKRMIF